MAAPTSETRLVISQKGKFTLLPQTEPVPPGSVLTMVENQPTWRRPEKSGMGALPPLPAEGITYLQCHNGVLTWVTFQQIMSQGLQV